MSLCSVSSRNEIKGGTNHNFVKFPGQNNKFCLFLAIQGGIVPPMPPSGGNTAVQQKPPDKNVTDIFKKYSGLEKLVARLPVGNLFNILGNKNQCFAAPTKKNLKIPFQNYDWTIVCSPKWSLMPSDCLNSDPRSCRPYDTDGIK
jgi:hypothetical protein